MIIQTKELGLVEVAESEIIRFERPVYGFPGALHFALLKKKKDDANPFMWLQNVDAKTPCFIVADPHTLFNDYAPPIPPEELARVGLREAGDLRLLLIAAVPENVRELSVNLRCPVIINARENRAAQVILEDDALPMRYRLFAKKEG